jgi:hypothetical protein
MKATKQQIRIIHAIIPQVYIKDKEQKQELVYQFTHDYGRTSTKDLTFNEANLLIQRFGGKPVSYDHWGIFDAKNNQHRKILSLLQEIGWTVYNEVRGQNVADIYRLSEWLKSSKSPINKPLKKLTSTELQNKIIPALEGIAKSTYKL